MSSIGDAAGTALKVPLPKGRRRAAAGQHRPDPTARSRRMIDRRRARSGSWGKFPSEVGDQRRRRVKRLKATYLFGPATLFFFINWADYELAGLILFGNTFHFSHGKIHFTTADPLFLIDYETTSSVPNDKSIPTFLKSQSISCLAKIIERVTKLYVIKYVYYENMIHEESHDTYSIS